MTASVLALNPGSSSLKAELNAPAGRRRAVIERIGSDGASLRVDGDSHPFAGDVGDAVSRISAALIPSDAVPDAVAVRVVHGGPNHREHGVVDDELVRELEAAIPLAPLHLPAALEVIAAARSQWPQVPVVACFDTAFFRTLPDASTRLPVAQELVDAGVRRYGFHGLSVASALRAVAPAGDTVVAHLGSGCSVSAVGADGRPRHTTMSLTPTGGIMSSTRPGDLDPEAVLYLIEGRGYAPERLRTLFNAECGLRGVSGGRRDMRDLAGASDASAGLAIEMFVRGVAMAVAGAAVLLDDWQTLVFTGGIGENDAAVRRRILAMVRPPATVRVEVVPADEEGEMVRIAQARLARASGPTR